VVRVLLIEDDAAIRTSVIRELSANGHEVTWHATGMAALAALLTDQPDVVVLDLGLPDVDGAQVLRMIRSTSEVPVIVATARSGTQAMVDVLDAGADDYVIKPYATAQLEARIRAVLRRGAADNEPDVLEAAGLRVDRTAHTASLAGEPLDLTRLEFQLLVHLMQHQGQVLSKPKLLAEVWHQAGGGSDRTVDVHLSWLRRKLGETAAEPRFLHTVRGVGVRFDPAD
jgi:DNA-binding response OmpR family regulator